MKKRISLLLLIPLFSFSQLSVKVDSLYTLINATEQVQKGIIGQAGETSYPEYDELYFNLNLIATDDELLYIAAKGNNTIKYEISNLLIDRKSKHLSGLFVQYLYNNQEINIRGGCTGNNSSLAGALYNHVLYQKNKIDEAEIYRKTYSIEELKKNHLPYETKWTKPEVDSLLAILNKKALSNDRVLPITLREIFWLNKFNFENQERIRYFANKYPEEEILATLASFQNKKDLPLLHQNLDKAYLAVSKFPDGSFIPELKARIDRAPFDYFYLEAVAGFKTKEAEELLSMVLAKFDSKRDNQKYAAIYYEQYNHFYSCLEKNGSAFTDALLLKLWLDHKFISISFFDKIKDRHYNELLKGFINPIPINVLNPVPTNITYNDDAVWEKYKADFEEADGYWCPVILKYLKNNSSQNTDKSIDVDKLYCENRT